MSISCSIIKYPMDRIIINAFSLLSLSDIHFTEKEKSWASLTTWCGPHWGTVQTLERFSNIKRILNTEGNFLKRLTHIETCLLPPNKCAPVYGKNHMLKQGSWNYDYVAKSSPLPAFVNKCYWSAITFIHLYVVYGCFCTALAELSTCSTD